MVESTMELLDWFRKQVEQADGDVLAEMLHIFAETLMDADASAACNAGFNEKSPDRTNTRNGYRSRTWDTRAGTIDLAVPKLRQGSYFPSWLFEPRRRAEKALIAVVADCYLAGVSTRRVDKLVKTLGSRGYRSPRSQRWPRAWMRWWSRSGTGRWMPGPMPTSGWMPWCRSLARAAG